MWSFVHGAKKTLLFAADPGWFWEGSATEAQNKAALLLPLLSARLHKSAEVPIKTRRSSFHQSWRPQSVTRDSENMCNWQISAVVIIIIRTGKWGPQECRGGNFTIAFTRNFVVEFYAALFKPLTYYWAKVYHFPSLLSWIPSALKCSWLKL